MKRRIIPIILVIVILSTTIISVAASDLIATPYYNNTMGTSTNFVISSSGKATISTAYNGYSGRTTSATVTSYIEKRTLGLFWTRVDIGEPDNEWVDTSSAYTDSFVHVHYLESEGTYRATVVYEIRGSGGATDVIDYEQERTYS